MVLYFSLIMIIQRPINMPWHKVLNGKPLNKDKAHDYIMALKEHVSKSVRPFILAPKKWNEWFQNRDGSETQSNKKEAIALDYSTFLEAVLMNYTAATLVESKQNNDMLLKYKMYRQNRQH